MGIKIEGAKPITVTTADFRKKLVASHQEPRAFEVLASAIEEGYEPSRYRALALTALEESALWLSKATPVPGPATAAEQNAESFGELLNLAGARRAA